MSTELRDVKRRAIHHQRDYSLGREAWAALYGVLTADPATAWTRCECGELITFDTNGDGLLVALEAHGRTRHECKVRAA